VCRRDWSSHLRTLGSESALADTQQKEAKVHRRKILLLCVAALGAMALSTGGLASGNAPDGTGTARAATLVFGAEQGGGPDWCLNQLLDVDCGAFWNVVYETPVIRGAYIFTPQFQYQPDLISKATVQRNPQRVTYYIRKNARWSDGIPVTGKDFKFTWQTVMNPKYKDHITQVGYEDIASVHVTGKTVTTIYKRNYAGWKGLFGFVLPQHALAGTDMLTVWNDCLCNPKKGSAPIGDGPFLLTHFDRGSGITLTRNARGWYGRRAKLAAILFRFITHTKSAIQTIKSGEVDPTSPQPQLALADLRNQAGLTVVSHVGLQWEHIEIQQGANGNPLAKQRWMRQALITALNRNAAARALYSSLNPAVGPLQSLVRLKGEGGYTGHFRKWNYNASKVESVMKAHSCSKGSDGIFRCGGTKVAFDFASTSGNALRTLAFTIFQDQAAKVGIELKNAFVPAGTLF